MASDLWLEASPVDSGKRLDAFLHERMGQFSRSRLQSWIEQGRVLVNGSPEKRSYQIKGAERIHVEPGELAPLRATPEELPLEVLYEDAGVIAINKPAGMVVHAGAGRHAGTLVNALLHRFGKLSTVGGDLRPGIVHRLDRFTSGVILVARTDAAHRNLADQFSSRRVEKVYLALVHGRVKLDQATVTKPITRDPHRRTRMTARLEHGRQAITTYRVLERFDKFTFLEVKIGTGRTHQIRVHLASVGHPVVGDPLYGAPASALARYFLHAHRITFTSPASGEPITVTSPLPLDLQRCLDHLTGHQPPATIPSL
ncbi:MAG TPA: RluA family pseudouridine synthase [Bryobacteraceae bacterium]|nr:RluA family pseudouridine synthase [Bryobacteraceae bacterium]